MRLPGLGALLLLVASAPAAGQGDASPGPVSVRFLARYDGMLVELASDERLCPEILVEGFALFVSPGAPIGNLPAARPIWILEASLSSDSATLSISMDGSIEHVDWALSPDSTTALLFLRADSAIHFPELAWIGPPDEPERPGVSYPDSVLVQNLTSGRPSPWLDEFDCVVIDPGHGGRDPGAVGWAGTYEKDRTLEVALLVRDLLAARCPDLRVIMTRDSDEYVSLGARTRIANSEHADLFISIHCNASTNRAAEGFETFFLSRARTDDARAVEALENGALAYDREADVTIQSDPLSFLLADIAQSLYLSQSSGLAEEVQSRFTEVWPDGRNRGVKQAGFYVLRGAYMPAVLVELAFISNPIEEVLLSRLDFRLRMAEAIVDAVMSFTEGIS
ncbi:N-acetylmuramoyl-L-alanine amidase [Candidatus Fermentibacterales bacterium]|nr:N-acetylmuramoyl-L-alanine amidase [Candidatus Fermentibacterales bacterium]